ncbi:GAF domain-containing protein [Leptolyngbyaceae cyanobacterium CCMR0082]|uniref:GAF domain-containing protein n=2 Tax=Adonisia turfae TaxID=2950184 RepID=A0A6M0SJT3_9CYAN|nr:GAF domain-containing protein [Adonisia turfae]MDV3353182.1 GAF domain-containing protein [Leptothoe sp. LEGE 181152]NEZ57312.1 GAF domain-containing protein [Adonisia turfae CCMR0081]NEZ68173.1 GAF domain-containing protein [Adonisia turfae CCMR0082]
MVSPIPPATCEQHLATLGQVLKNVWDQDTVDTQLTELADYMQQLYPNELTWIGLYDAGDQSLTTQMAVLGSGKNFLWQKINLQTDDAVQQVIERGAPAAVYDLQESHRAGEWKAIAKRLGIHDAIIFPIQRQNECLGILLLGASRRGASLKSGVQKKTFSILVTTIATILHRYQKDYYQQLEKRPSQPFFQLLAKLETIQELEPRLQAIVDATHRFVGASRTRGYWFEPQQRFFWHRVANGGHNRHAYATQEPGVSQLSASGYQEVYQALSCGDVIVIGEDTFSHPEAVIEPLKQAFGKSSLLVAPILMQGDLLGFLVVESTQPRQWSVPEKRYLTAAAQVVSLGMPTSVLQERVADLEANHQLSVGIAQSIHGDRDWQSVMSQCAEQLIATLEIDGLLVLIPDLECGGFEVGYQHHGTQSKPTQGMWRSLHDVDWQLLARKSAPVCIENLDNDLKLRAWHPQFLQMGMKSAMACNLSPGQAPEGVLVVTDSHGRRWNQTEQDLLQSVGRQIGLVLHQWSLQRQAQQQSQMNETMQWGLRNLQRTFDVEQLQQAATHHVSQLLRLPLVALIVWENGQKEARLASTVIREQQFAAKDNPPILVESDAVINWAIQTDGVIQLEFEDLPDVTRQWLRCPAHAQLLVVALRTSPEHTLNGTMVLADHGDRRFSDQQMSMLAVLVHQLAWCRRHLLLTNRLREQKSQLTELNWYKHHHMDDIRRQVRESRRQLANLKQLPEISEQPYFHAVESRLAGMEKELLRLTGRERWAMASDPRKVPLIGLLNRLMKRVQTQVQKKQLWTQVHCDSNLALQGEMQKIEFILYELISAACRRSPARGRVDVWSRPLEQHWIELSITDDGDVDEAIIKALSEGNHQRDHLAESPLDRPPGLNLAICQSLMIRLGGEFILEKLEDNRIRSSVMFPMHRLHTIGQD